MVSHREVAQAFARGEKATGSRMFTDGSSIWSHGYHFCISTKIAGGYLFNTDHYSSSTSSHQSHVRRVLPQDEIIECNTEEIKSAIDNPDKPIVITRRREPHTYKEACEMLADKLKEEGVQYFSLQRLKDGCKELIEKKDKKHFETFVFGGNRLSIKKKKGSVIIKSRGKEIELTNSMVQDLVEILHSYHPLLYHSTDLQLIKAKFQKDEFVSDYVQKVMDRTLKFSEEMNKIKEEQNILEQL